MPNVTKVLCVEDDKATRDVFVDLLTLEGFEVEAAGTAEEGLALLQRNHFDLVVTDYSMPGSTGTWMLEEAADQGLLEGTEAFMMTAHRPEQNDRAQLLTKPLDANAFLLKISRFLKPARRAELESGRSRSATLSVQLIDAERSLARARATHDLNALYLTVAPEFTAQIDARRVKRSEWIEAVSQPEPQLVDVVVTPIVEGELALVTAELVASDRTMITDVWVMREGHWRLVSRSSATKPATKPLSVAS